MVRSFEVRAKHPNQVRNLAKSLDVELCYLQDEGWKILSVTSTPTKEWERVNGSYDSTLFTIVAEHADGLNEG